MPNCATCSSVLKLIPAGVSKKTGKGYPAFYVCDTNKCFQPKEEFKGWQKDTALPSEVRESIKEPDWDKIAEGKVRNGVAIAFIPIVGGGPCLEETKEVMQSWVNWIMQGS